MLRTLVLRFGAIGDFIAAVEFCRAHASHDLLFCPSIERFLLDRSVINEFPPGMTREPEGFSVQYGALQDYSALVKSGRYSRVIVLAQGPGGRKTALLTAFLKWHRRLASRSEISIKKYFHGGQYVWQLNGGSRIRQALADLPSRARVSIFYDSKEIANSLSAGTVAHIILRLKERLVDPQITLYGLAPLEVPLGLPFSNVSGETRLEDLPLIFDKTDLAVTCDSGPLHAFSARGIPCITFMSARQPLLNWTPLAPQNYYIFDDSIECLGCGKAVCPRGENICVNSPVTLEKFDAAFQ